MLGTLSPELMRLVIFVGVSLLGILIALIAMGVVYSGSRGQVSQVIVGYYGTGWIWFAPEHLGREHEGKAPIITLKVEKKPVISLIDKKATILQRNTKYVHNSDYERKSAPGGRICLDKASYDALLKKLGMGPVTNDLADLGPVDVDLRYHSWLNIPFLFGHPDFAVRISAWIFLLTSLFGVFQVVLTQVLGY